MFIALQVSYMTVQCSLYPRLLLWPKLHYRAINEKYKAMNIYNALQNHVIVTLTNESFEPFHVDVIRYFNLFFEFFGYHTETSQFSFGFQIYPSKEDLPLCLYFQDTTTVTTYL